MKQRYTKRIVAFALALAMVLTGGAFSTVFNTASASAASKESNPETEEKSFNYSRQESHIKDHKEKCEED